MPQILRSHRTQTSRLSKTPDESTSDEYKEPNFRDTERDAIATEDNPSHGFGQWHGGDCRGKSRR